MSGSDKSQLDRDGNQQRWRLLGADRLSLRGPRVNSCIWFRAVNHRTINIVLCVVIIIMCIHEFAAVLIRVIVQVSLQNHFRAIAAPVRTEALASMTRKAARTIVSVRQILLASSVNLVSGHVMRSSFFLAFAYIQRIEMTS